MNFTKASDKEERKSQEKEEHEADSSGICTFLKAKLSTKESEDKHSHALGHSHDHGHTHEHMSSPGNFSTRDKPLYRTDFDKRAFTVGIGGPVGSGKTALVLSLCKVLRDKYNLCIVTNDIFTREDWEFLVKNEALPAERIRAVETGGCPHAAIREDYSLNLEVVKELTKEFKPDMIFLESGGDNLAANFSRDLADYIIYVIDVAETLGITSEKSVYKLSCVLAKKSTKILNSGGDKIPRKGGPGITESDLLVINKVDLAEAVGASIQVMKRDAEIMRNNGPSIITEATHMKGVETVATHILLGYREMVDKSLKLPFF